MIADAPAPSALSPSLAPPREYALTGEERVFFLHLPKTAGTTLGNALESHFPRRRIFPHYSLGELNHVTPGMCDGYTYFRGHYKYDVIRALIGEDPICITMLRDPIERFISHFAHWRNQRLGGPEVGFDAFAFDSLADYLAHEDVVVATRNLDAQVDVIGGAPDFDDINELASGLTAMQRRPQYADAMPVGFGRTHFTRARERLNRFAFVGIAERFQESLFLLSYTFGWRPILDSARLNVSPQRPLRASLDAETLARIASFNTLDQELYDHAARLFEERYTRMTEDLIGRYAPERALSTRPLSLIEVYELLEQQYAERFAASHQPVRHLLIDFEESVAGEGWYPPEALPGHGTVRWTGPGTTATLDLPLAADEDLLIRFRVITAGADDLLASVTLAANGHPVALNAGPDVGGATLFTGHIPRSALAGNRDRAFVRLALGVHRTIPVAGAGDTRHCGLLVDWITVAPEHYTTDW